MVDTIKLAWPLGIMPLPDDLTKLGWLAHYNEFSGKLVSWSYKEKKESKFPRLSLFRAKDGLLYVVARLSLPAFVHGSNARLLRESEVNNALSELCGYVSDKLQRECAITEAIVWEAHFAKDFHFGEENIPWVVSELANMNIAGLQGGIYRKQTLYFHSKGSGNEAKKPRVLCIYPKMADCITKKFPATDIKAAEGNIRVELRYRTTNSVKALVGSYPLPDRFALTVLTQEVCDRVLNPIEDQISRLLEESAKNDPIATLTRAYGKRRAATLIAFLAYLHFYKEDFYKISSLGYPRSSYYKCLKQCREAGIYRLIELSDSEVEIGGLL